MSSVLIATSVVVVEGATTVVGVVTLAFLAVLPSMPGGVLFGT
jgi:hypothetical protein